MQEKSLNLTFPRLILLKRIQNIYHFMIHFKGTFIAYSNVTIFFTEPYGVSPQEPSTVVTKAKRGRKPNQRSLKNDMKTKLERSRQSARECRARKKLRYNDLINCSPLSFDEKVILDSPQNLFSNRKF